MLEGGFNLPVAIEDCNQHLAHRGAKAHHAPSRGTILARHIPPVVIIAGMPRSGTTWLGQIFDSHPDTAYRVCPLFCYSLKNALTLESPRSAWQYVLERAFLEPTDYMLETAGRLAGDLPVFPMKSVPPQRLVLKFDHHQDLVGRALDLFEDLLVVAIVRNPCAAIDSWLRAPREFPQTADPILHWRDGAIKKRWPGDHFGFDDWVRLAKSFLALQRHFPERVRLVRYEELVHGGAPVADSLLGWSGLPPNRSVAEFVHASQSRHSEATYGVFKNPRVVDAWRERLPGAIREAIERELRGTPLEIFLE